jgi:anti-sigma regulatory factor (Ser/Thr protein kinase)
MTAHPVPRFTPAPRDPAATDHSWADGWPRRSQLELGALDTAPACARAHARAALREWGLDVGAADDAQVILSELVTNAVAATRAARSAAPVRYWMLGDGTSILILVWDATSPAPLLAPATPHDEHGRGLSIVEGLSSRWGWYFPAEQSGKVVWAVLPGAAMTPVGPWQAAL